MNKGDGALVVKRAAAGLGLFALRDIKAGRRIIEYVGPVVMAEEVSCKRGRYFFEINEYIRPRGCRCAKCRPASGKK